MKAVWRYIHASRNTYACLYAACEKYGWILEPVESAEDAAAADIVCYSLNSLNYEAYADEIAACLAITIAGGPHASACWKEVTRIADFVVVGEGERTLPRLLDAVQNGRATDSIPGVATAAGFTPIDHSVYLNHFPCFAQMKGYIELSRGCPFNCGYCQTPRLHGTKMRHRSREAIVEMAHKYRDARFVTPNAFAYGSSDGRHPDVEKLGRLLSSMPENNIYFGTFPSEVRPEFVSTETASLVSEYCSNKNLHFGAQSASDAVLSRLHRGHTAADVYNALDVCRDTGLMPVVDIIFGFPFETDEDEEANLKLIRDVTRFGKMHVHYLTPLPGTPLAGAEPRAVSAKVNRELGKLALNGRVTGYWADKNFEVGHADGKIE
ncbi:MAG TPA: TIGR04013 family B12-binding domain/radical SAM domain-containing protein [Methanocorpusculum sp.]|nr:TIGR04013 family B12-binding domain/radical SAM domain-containing protein [Methanocorpusculum sp.]